MNNFSITMQLDKSIVESAVESAWEKAFLHDAFNRGHGMQWIDMELREYLTKGPVREQLAEILERLVREKLRECAAKVVDDILRGTLKKQLQSMLKDGSLVHVLKEND